jgi:hypothetical protein
MKPYRAVASGTSGTQLVTTRTKEDETTRKLITTISLISALSTSGVASTPDAGEPETREGIGSGRTRPKTGAVRKERRKP